MLIKVTATAETCAPFKLALFLDVWRLQPLLVKAASSRDCLYTFVPASLFKPNDFNYFSM